MEIILASQSPRRKELLKKITQDFTVVHSQVNEEDIKENDPVLFAIQAAVLKARDVGEKHPTAVVIAADTVVSLDGRIIGKPKSYNEAKEILILLSGRRHKVITGIAVYRKDQERLLTDYELTYVQFSCLQEQEIENYLAQADYEDKAGAYAIQRQNDTFVKKIYGNYDNVVGLPVKKTKKLLEKFFLPEFETEIFDIVFPNNWTVGKVDNKVVFVSGAVYGDKIKARIVKESKNFSYAEATFITAKSPFRIQPECIQFGRCGGCAFQDTVYEKQIELKERYLLTTLQKLGGINTQVIERYPIIPSPDKYFYRNKMEFAFGTDKNQLVIGMRQRKIPFNKYQDRIVPLDGCPIFSKAVERIFPIVRQFARQIGRDAYNPYTKEGFFRHLVIREGKYTGQIMVILVTRSSPSFNLTGLVESLSTEDIKSLWWVENDRVADVVSFEKKNHLLGNTFIEEKMETLRYKIYPSTFFQSNTKAAEALYCKIKDNLIALNAKKVLGLYCGSGAIETFISNTVESVEGVDIEPANIHNALENCRLNGIENCLFHTSPVEAVLNNLLLKEYDTLIVDPPRAGITPQALKNILSLKVGSIIYVSCNPAAFARDISKIQQEGYRLTKLYSADFFPHTPHLEAMGLLIK